MAFTNVYLNYLNWFIFMFLRFEVVGLNIFYFLNKYDNISIHCNLQTIGSERKQECLYSSSPEHIKFVKITGRILNVQYKVYLRKLKVRICLIMTVCLYALSVRG